MTALKIVQRFYPEVTKVVDATESTFVQVTGKDCKSKEVNLSSHDYGREKFK